MILEKGKMHNSGVMLITGTRKGIGCFLAGYYTDRGYFVEGCSRKPPEYKIQNYYHHTVDVSNEEQVKAMVSSIQRRHGRLDVVINNAGIASMNHIFLTPERTVKRILDVNVKGTFLVSRESGKLMKKRRFGRIVNFSTIAVPFKLEGEAIYATSKSAIETLSKITARELSEFGITCNVIAPAPVETDLIKGVPREKIDNLIGRLAVKRLGRFEDIVNVIDFFIKPESDYITGQVIYLGGAG